ncbi:MAG: hypothetical protein WC389_00065 [Lutibacter sp.]|jgi:hypothetical protein
MSPETSKPIPPMLNILFKLKSGFAKFIKFMEEQAKDCPRETKW